MKRYRARPPSLNELAASKRAKSGRQCPDIELGRERQLAGLTCTECGERPVGKRRGRYGGNLRNGPLPSTAKGGPASPLFYLRRADYR